MKIGSTRNANAAQSLIPLSKREAAEKEAPSAQAAQQEENGKYDSISLSREARSQLRSNTDGAAFSNRSELVSYLRENYSAYQRGIVSISGSYLDECLKDGDKLSNLENILEGLPDAEEKIKSDLPKNTRLVSCAFYIDENGDMATEVITTSVGFNAAKRSAELGGAVSVSDVNMVLAKLQKDLSDVQSGGCDADTIAQVKNMIRKAEEKMQRLRSQEDEDAPSVPSMPVGMELPLSVPPFPSQTE